MGYYFTGGLAKEGSPREGDFEISRINFQVWYQYVITPGR